MSSSPSYSDSDASTDTESLAKIARPLKRKAVEAYFPNHDFDYGGSHNDDWTNCDKDTLLEKLDAASIYCQGNDGSNGYWRLPWPSKIAKFYKYNVFGEDEPQFDERQKYWASLIFQPGTDSVSFWSKLLDRIPPRLRPKDVIRQLCTIQPNSNPKCTILFFTVMSKVEKCRTVGKALSWSDEADIQFPDFPGEDELEALRIYGSLEDGMTLFGKLPDETVEAMKEAGIYFLLVDKEKRIVPLCWKKAADAVGLEYAATAPTERRSIRKYKINSLSPE